MDCSRCGGTGEMQVTDPDGYTVGLPCDACELREWIERAVKAEAELASLKARRCGTCVWHGLGGCPMRFKPDSTWGGCDDWKWREVES